MMAQTNMSLSAGKTSPPIRNVVPITIIVMLSFLVSSFFYLYWAIQTEFWQAYALFGLHLIGAAASLIGSVLGWRGRTSLGMWFILGAGLIVIPVISFLVVDVGLVLGVFIFLACLFMAGQALPAKQGRWAILGGVLSGVVALLPDLFGVQDRLAVSALNAYIPVAVGFVVLATGSQSCGLVCLTAQPTL